MSGSGKTSKGLTLGIVAIGLFLAVALLMRPRGTTDIGDISSSTPQVASAPPALELTDPNAAASIAASEAGDDLPEAIRRYLAANIYPPTSGRLDEGAVDLLQPNRRYEKPKPVDDDSLTYIFTADRYFYTGEDIAAIWLEIFPGDGSIDVSIRRATATAEGADAETVNLKLNAQGNRWSTELPIAETFGNHHGTILLSVAFTYGRNREQIDEIRIFQTPEPPAQLTGTFYDQIVDGSLRTDIGVNVAVPGFYRFDANLYDANGKPIAFAVFKGELVAGHGNIPFDFFGKVLRDAGKPGPYSIGEIRGYRFLDAQHPDRERLPDHSPRYRTQAYTLSQFSDTVYTSPHKENMVSLMLEDEAAGRSLDLPDFASP